MKYKVLMVLMIIALLFIPLSCHQQQEIPPQDETGANVTWVTPSEDELLGQYEDSNLLFERIERHGRIIYFHHRKIDDAIVELDRKVYMFDNETRELIEKDIHWRDDLPSHLPSIISKEEAETIGGGCCATLLYIDPDSAAFSIKSTKSPCWAVRIYEEFNIPDVNETVTHNTDVIVVDAVTGEILGHGTPIP